MQCDLAVRCFGCVEGHTFSRAVRAVLVAGARPAGLWGSSCLRACDSRVGFGVRRIARAPLAAFRRWTCLGGRPGVPEWHDTPV